MARERIVSGVSAGEDEQRLNYALRPQRFDQYVGQSRLVEKLRIAVEAARRRGEPVEHTLLHGPPGLGKTTLAHVIANEVGAKLHVTAGPALTKGADLVGILTKLGHGDILFIDEIHRLNPVVEEYLYPAMEDYKIDITLDQGAHARSVTLPLPPFTLIGATTRVGLLAGPMRDRFGIREHLDFYTTDDLFTILQANARLLRLDAERDALIELAARSRGTPRIANRLLRRVRDYAAVRGPRAGTPPEPPAPTRLTLDLTRQALDLEGIDALGLDELDRQFLLTLIRIYRGGPAGIEALAATLGEEIDTLVDVVEPFLLQSGLVVRTRQGRRATAVAYDHLRKVAPDKLGSCVPPAADDDAGLFGTRTDPDPDDDGGP
ncbi:MAG: Holliday junction branch migration DNA helicase RuvB [Tepidisphaerales bacterium]